MPTAPKKGAIPLRLSETNTEKRGSLQGLVFSVFSGAMMRHGRLVSSPVWRASGLSRRACGPCLGCPSEVAFLRDEVIGLVVNPQTAFRLSGIIEIHTILPQAPTPSLLTSALPASFAACRRVVDFECDAVGNFSYFCSRFAKNIGLYEGQIINLQQMVLAEARSSDRNTPDQNE